MVEWRARGDPVAVETVLREWVKREARKPQYPDADPGEWHRERLATELAETYEEPVDPVLEDRLDWRAVTLSGEELGRLGTFPEPSWARFSGDGTVAGAVDRLSQPEVAAEFPDATEKIEWFAERPTTEFGAAVAWQRDGDWPPVLLDGNHRACGIHEAARRGTESAVVVHLGYEVLPER